MINFGMISTKILEDRLIEIENRLEELNKELYLLKEESEHTKFIINKYKNTNNNKVNKEVVSDSEYFINDPAMLDRGGLENNTKKEIIEKLLENANGKAVKSSDIYPIVNKYVPTLTLENFHATLSKILKAGNTNIKRYKLGYYKFLRDQ